MTVPGALELLAAHVEDHAIVMRVPDADFFSVSAHGFCYNNAIGVFAENEQLAEARSIQPLPIKPNPFQPEPAFIGEFN